MQLNYVIQINRIDLFCISVFTARSETNYYISSHIKALFYKKRIPNTDKITYPRLVDISDFIPTH